MADKEEWENSMSEEEKDKKEDWVLSLVQEADKRIDV